MRIGLITITDRENYGNRLQNYAIEKNLTDLGCTVETIRKGIYKTTYLEKLKFFIRKNFRIKYSRYLKRVDKFNKFNQRYIHFSNKYILSDDIDYNLSAKYDVFICGSDQIWNSEFAFNSDAEYLSFVTGKKKIALAASFGTTEIKDEEKEHIGCLLDKFDAISVREKSGKKIVEENSSKEAVVLSDPTITLSTKEWSRIENPPKGFVKDKFIVCYILGVYDKSMVENIRNYAKENRLDVVFLENDYYKYKITTEEEFSYGPEEFLWLIRHAEKVITDSFHAAAFSLIFEKKFLIISGGDAQKKMGGRFEQLARTYDIKNLYVIDDNYDSEAQYDKEYVQNIIKEQGRVFKEYLKKTLEI